AVAAVCVLIHFVAGAASMTGHRRLAITEVGPVTVVRFADRRILDDANIQEIGQELYQLVEEEGRDRLLLNLCDVEFLASSALGKLITLQRKMKAREIGRAHV